MDSLRYLDGLYPQFPHARLVPFTRYGYQMKYARTVGATPSSVWAIWLPDVTISGLYEISVWVPGQNATTSSARYYIHGVVGEQEPVVVAVNQNRYYDTWVSLGVFTLDAANPTSGQVNLTNHTGEEGRQIAFAPIRWQKVPSLPTGDSYLADGFDAPIGTQAERQSLRLWPGDWVDATGFGRYYRLRSGYAYHTGADLNLNTPRWDSDKGKTVVAPASGTVTFAGWLVSWGNVVVIRHDPLSPGGSNVYARLAHLDRVYVREGERVRRGQPVGTVGQDEHGGPFHLHFDLSPTDVLYYNPGDWPGLDRARLYRDYLDPREFIRRNRP